MKKAAVLLVLLAMFLIMAPNASAQLALGAKAGTLGLGVEANVHFGGLFSFTAGINALKWGHKFTADEVEYDGDLDFKSLALLANWHPSRGGFRVTAGLLLNGNEVLVTAEPQGSYEFGGTEYPGELVGEVDGTVNFNDIAPYAGIGWGYDKDARWGFYADFGAIFQGAADVTLTADGPIAIWPGFQEDLKSEEEAIEDELQNFQVYPVISLGVYIRF